MSYESALIAQFMQHRHALLRPFDELRAIREVPVARVTAGDIGHRGIRGVPTLVTNVSTVRPREGLLFRGYPIRALAARSVLELMWLGITGLEPEPWQLASLHETLVSRAIVPRAVNDRLDALIASCAGMEPILVFSSCMAQLASACPALPDDPEARLATAVEHVERIVALSLPLIGRINARATGAPRAMPIDWRLSWGENLGRALGIAPRMLTRAVREVLEVYGVVHIDQGKGNPSSHVSHIVSTTGADPYRCIAASTLALSGPSHAYAGIGVLDMLGELEDRFGEPDDAEIRGYLVERITGGQRVFGIGQAVMKNPDTRFLALQAAARELVADDPQYRIMQRVLAQAPEAFRAAGNRSAVVQPNVNMISAIVLGRTLGVDRSMLPLAFAASRLIGNLCQYVENALVGARVCRPQSHTTAELMSVARTARRDAAGVAAAASGASRSGDERAEGPASASARAAS